MMKLSVEVDYGNAAGKRVPAFGDMRELIHEEVSLISGGNSSTGVDWLLVDVYIPEPPVPPVPNYRPFTCECNRMVYAPVLPTDPVYDEDDRVWIGGNPCFDESGGGLFPDWVPPLEEVPPEVEIPIEVYIPYAGGCP